MPDRLPLFTILNSVDSTNNYAMAKVHAGLAKHGNAYYSADQTEGKGQRGKTWNTEKGQNIALSIVIQPTPLLVKDQFKLSAVVALACYEFISHYAGVGVAIKWPNDIYYNDKKAAGILIENIIGMESIPQKLAIIENVNNSWKYAIVGIGVNINQILFDTSIKNIVSLQQITGKKFDCLVLAQELHRKVLDKVEILLKGSFKEILSQYNAQLFKKDSLVKLKRGNIVFETTIRSVTENGQLFTTDAVERYFNFGEVQWVL